MAVFFCGTYFRAGCPVREARSKPVEMSNNQYTSQDLCTMPLKAMHLWGEEKPLQIWNKSSA